jgi:hypothetical protein
MTGVRGRDGFNSLGRWGLVGWWVRVCWGRRGSLGGPGPLHHGGGWAWRVCCDWAGSDWCVIHPGLSPGAHPTSLSATLPAPPLAPHSLPCCPPSYFVFFFFLALHSVLQFLSRLALLDPSYFCSFFFLNPIIFVYIQCFSSCLPRSFFL